MYEKKTLSQPNFALFAVYKREVVQRYAKGDHGKIDKNPTKKDFSL
jgi:hypothetical protein